MNRIEQSLLLYLETCAVDHGGKVESVRMNEEDHAIARRWTVEGFIIFRRIKFKEIRGTRTHTAALSEPAWEAAHRLRRERVARMAGAALEGKG